MKRKRKQRDRLAIFRDGLELLRWLATDDISVHDAMAAGIHYREFYRWLNAFKAMGFRLRRTKNGAGIYYSINRGAFERWIRGTPKPTRKHAD